MSELFDDVVEDYRVNRRKSLVQLESRLKNYVRPAFEQIRAFEFSTAHIKRYVAQRLGDGAANATINRELEIVDRAFALAARCEPSKVLRTIHVPMLVEDNARTGFLDDEGYLRLRHELPEFLRPIFVAKRLSKTPRLPCYAGLAAAHAARWAASGSTPPRRQRRCELQQRRLFSSTPCCPNHIPQWATAFARDAQWDRSEKSFRQAIELDQTNLLTVSAGGSRQEASLNELGMPVAERRQLLDAYQTDLKVYLTGRFIQRGISPPVTKN